MIEPQQHDIGRAVSYRCAPNTVEQGVITSFNERFVFVRFVGDHGSKACDRANLDWSFYVPDKERVA